MVFCSLPGLCRPTRAPEETLSPVFCSGLPDVFDIGLTPLNRAFWQPWPGSYLSHPCRGVRVSQGTINPGPHPDISSLESPRCLSASGGPGRPHWVAFIHRPFPEQRADGWQNGELNIYGWKTRKAQEEGSLSAWACCRNIIHISTVVPGSNAHSSHYRLPPRSITSRHCCPASTNQVS